MLFLFQVAEPVEKLIEESYKVSPFGYQLYGFVIALLVVLLCVVTFAYYRKDIAYSTVQKEHSDLQKELTEKVVEAITKFLASNDSDRIREREERQVGLFKEALRDVFDEQKYKP